MMATYVMVGLDFFKIWDNPLTVFLSIKTPRMKNASRRRIYWGRDIAIKSYSFFLDFGVWHWNG